jgi:uncharacterized protein YcgI (DUF1989 family)
MNYQHNCKWKRWEISEPVSRPGDYIELRAELDCLVGLSNCPEDRISDCNARNCTPMKIAILEP